MTEKPDSYGGFNEYNPLLDTEVSRGHLSSIEPFDRAFASQSLKYDTDLQQAVLKTSHGRRAPPVVFNFIFTSHNG